MKTGETPDRRTGLGSPSSSIKVPTYNPRYRLQTRLPRRRPRGGLHAHLYLWRLCYNARHRLQQRDTGSPIIQVTSDTPHLHTHASPRAHTHTNALSTKASQHSPTAWHSNITDVSLLRSDPHQHYKVPSSDPQPTSPRTTLLLQLSQPLASICTAKLPVLYMCTI